MRPWSWTSIAQGAGCARTNPARFDPVESYGQELVFRQPELGGPGLAADRDDHVEVLEVGEPFAILNSRGRSPLGFRAVSRLPVTAGEAKCSIEISQGWALASCVRSLGHPPLDP